MKLIFSVLRIFLILLVGFFIGRWFPINTYKETVGMILDIDTVENTYTVNMNDELLKVETELPLPEPNKKIIILLPK